MADKSLLDSIKEGASGVTNMYSLGYKKALGMDAKEEEQNLIPKAERNKSAQLQRNVTAAAEEAEKTVSKPKTFTKTPSKTKADKPPKGLDNDRTDSLEGLDAKSVSKQAAGGRVGSGLGCGAAMRGFGAVRKK